MKRHRTIAATLTLLLSATLLAPVAAHASGPLLSGYGPPGAGAQTILGAALLNGPGGGSAGGSSSDVGGTAHVASRATGAKSLVASSQRSANRNQGHARRGRASARSTAARGVLTSSTHPRAAGATPNSSHLGGASAVVDSESGTSWFSGSDLLALVLASAALALVALATVRLTQASMIESTEDEAVGTSKT